MFLAHLLILEYIDHHQNLISSSLYYPGPLHKISSQSVHYFLSNVVHKQTNRQTNATKNITFFAKEVTIERTTCFQFKGSAGCKKSLKWCLAVFVNEGCYHFTLRQFFTVQYFD